VAEAFEILRDVKGNTLVLSLKGNITEDSALEELKKELKPTVVLDLKNVQRINSYGIRQWINVMKEVQAGAKQVIFHRCPAVIVEQFNMINNFGGGGMVYSVYLPYFCESCGQEESKLYSLPNGVSQEQPAKLDQFNCSKCNNPLTFNDIEDEYFYFLQHQKGRSVDPDVLKQLQQMT
jgi:anti-anti-sigma regulatory factor